VSGEMQATEERHAQSAIEAAGRIILAERLGEIS
jgi:hypothetical protein